MNARADRFPLVDSLRAIAALAVLGTHAASSRRLHDGRPSAATRSGSTSA